QAALEAAGAPLGLSALETAEGIVTIAEAQMARALRVISVERGFDPRDFTLLAFGGAGGMHACRLAEELGPTTVLVPRAAGVLSALGLASADLRRDYVGAFLADLDTLDRTACESAYAELEAQARRELGSPDLRRLDDLRYRSQSFELTVPAAPLEGLGERFAAAHRRRYGFELPVEDVQIVSIRLTATVPVERPQLTRPAGGVLAACRNRAAWFDGGWSEVPVRAPDELAPGRPLAGPAIV